MNAETNRFTLTLLGALAAILVTGSSLAGAQSRVVLQADQGQDTISRFIYGQFAEHLGHGIYGGVFVGEGNKTIPNTRGMRNDVVQALRRIKVPVIRWPGGCFADTYHWKDGIGPKDRRPTIVNVWWGNTTENNSFGTNEFLDFCGQVGAEPFIAGNVGSGTVEEFTQWVQYVNFDGTSPMSDLRAKSGHKDPWNVRFWGIANEPWGCGGNMTPEFYANLYKLFATFATGSSNKTPLYRVAAGGYGEDFHWTEVLMKDIPTSLREAVGLHYYSVIDWNHKGSDVDFTEQQYFATMKRALLLDYLVKMHSVIMDRYDPEKKVGLVVDEWGGWYDVEKGTNPAFLYQQNTMRDAMIAGATLNSFNNHCDRVRMANLAQMVNVLQAVILTDGPKMVLTPTYHVMDLYAVHHDALRLPLTVKSAPYVMGSDTLDALSVSASRDREGVTHVSLVNIDADSAQDVSIDCRGANFTSVQGRILASRKVQDHNTFDDPDKVHIAEYQGAALHGSTVQLRMPPCSVVVLTLR